MLYIPKLGAWRPDKTQDGTHDDYKFSDLVPKLTFNESDPSNTDLRRFCSPVENQGHVGSCVANSVVGALEFLQIKNGIPFHDLSRLFVYYNARLMTQTQDQDDGCIIRMAMGTLSSLGTCTETKWPYDVKQVFVRPSWGSYREAYGNKIGSFYRIDGVGSTRIDQIKQALQAQHPVVFGMIVDQDYMDIGSNGLVSMPRTTRVNAGGHAQLIVGNSDTQKIVIVRNSWGTGWGDHGYAYVPYDYLDAASADDFWVPTALV